MKKSHTPGDRPSRLRPATAVVLPLFLIACAGAVRPGSTGPPAPERDLKDFVDVEVATVALDLGHGTPLALLHDNWQRILPVWVGNEEALAIARARHGNPVPRPLTHDLFTNVLEGLGGTLVDVLVYDLRDDLYYGLLRIRVDGEIREFDARPSDGLALAVRTGARIRVDPRLFETAPTVDFISMEGERPIVRMRGITVSTLSGDSLVQPEAQGAPPGVLVLHADEDATSHLVRRGDVIRAVNGRDIDSPRHFVSAVQAVPNDVALSLSLARGGKELAVRVPPRAVTPRRS